jgi:cobalt-zinc-cadmium efflux system outer membrane protein
VLSLDLAVNWALQNNPELMALRQRHGMAAAAVVIANTYPFNPIWEGRIQGNSGPESAGITNQVAQEHLFLWQVELRGQGTFRRQQAAASLTRTDWEIAFAEQTLAVRVLKAFQTVLHRQEKLGLIEEAIKLNEQTVKDVEYLFKNAKGPAVDTILAQTELDTTRAQLSAGRLALATAGSELLRALGVVDGLFQLDGTLELPLPPEDVPALQEQALARRADLRARKAAVDEAEAALQLTIANRYGSPTVGPAFTYDPTRVSSVGIQLNVPLPVCNTHRGEIQQREAERYAALLELRKTEVLIRQDVQAAMARLTAARALAETYRKTLDNLGTALKKFQELFDKMQPGVDALRMIDLRRKLILARNGYLDALFEMNLARADLIAAVGGPASAAPCADPPGPEAPPKP